MKTVATIEARMTSTRLPGKVMLPALDRPLLAHLTSRLRAAPSIDDIVLATTVNATDDVLEEFAEQDGIKVFRGSEEDVMSRVIGAAESAQADVVVEITGDCPIIDPDLVEQTIRMFNRNEEAAYCANSVISCYPDGMDTQVMTLRALKRSFSMTDDPLDREHVSRHIVQNPQLFPHVYLIAPPSLHWPGLGLTLDEPSDYELIRTLIENLGPENPLFGCGDVIRFLRANPQVLMINDMVQRKDARPT
ncbi:MAG: 8-amino-3,8-dideoxy-manno-octulosonate cytidylyltransferase [Gammaproteobacteria bacterium]|nr:MAG: 8-amino-3,8-dideoxy-manno-octulosonate cytidylyltransferase [Gammaproteobacteria bacterium]